ncbi:hypothetical protein [Floridanema aerugineum]|jgi:hypothetical protein|uniref:Uncharacterized protein n=1 Tax=Floridaenema aerugineum BLCC-F46 TaxID=3153654 RepID=A0ABV4XIV5_9CYAN
MNTQINTTSLAFLLALQELNTPLSETEKQTLTEVADQLDYQPKAWESFTEPLLVKMITSNPELNQKYQFYKLKLDSLGNINGDLLPTATEIEQLKSNEIGVTTRGFKPQSEATGYNQQINNAVILISRAEQPEEIAKKLSFTEKVKQLLG